MRVSDFIAIRRKQYVKQRSTDMPAFKEDWKKAKTAFEAATGKKKPSATMLGFIKKGSGIESALASADGAKTAGDLQKAMAAFQKAVDDYAKPLEKAINDPKVTPVADKVAYAAAVKKLKDDLAAIHKSAHGAMELLVEKGAKTKDKVDPAELRKFADGEKAVKAHTAERLALAKKLEKVLAGYKAKGVEAAAVNAIKQAQAAKAARSAGNTMGGDVAAGAAERFSDQAASLLEEINNDWKTVSTGGDMIKLRLDPAFGDLDPAKKAAYQKDAGAAWAQTEKVQREVMAYIAKLRTEVGSATTAAESVEGLRIGKNTPDVFIKRVSEIKSRLGVLSGGVLSKYAGKVENVRGQQKTWLEKMKKDEKLKVPMKKQWGQLKAEHEHALKQTGQSIDELKQTQERLKGIPQDDKAVKSAVADATAELLKVRQMAADYTTQGTMLVKELDTYLALT
jgi:hypothetical protein